MSTQAKILANRLNAQKSTGPRTPAGKAVVAKNALKHGLTARKALIRTEKTQDFAHHRDRLLEEIQPVGPIEEILAERLVNLSWRLKRAGLIQNQTIDALIEDQISNPFARILKSMLHSPKTPLPSNSHESQPDLTLGTVAVKDFSNARILDRLLMYERRIENSLFKTLLELQRLNLIRSIKQTNYPNTQNPHLTQFTPLS